MLSTQYQMTPINDDFLLDELTKLTNEILEISNLEYDIIVKSKVTPLINPRSILVLGALVESAQKRLDYMAFKLNPIMLSQCQMILFDAIKMFKAYSVLL